MASLTFARTERVKHVGNCSYLAILGHYTFEELVGEYQHWLSLRGYVPKNALYDYNTNITKLFVIPFSEVS